MPNQTIQSVPVANRSNVQEIEKKNPDFFSYLTSSYELLKIGSKIDSKSLALSYFQDAAEFEEPFTWSHAEWFNLITQSANMFRGLGIERNDVVAYVLPNLPETHLTIWGGEAAGIVMAINPLLEATAIANLLRAGNVTLLVTLANTPGSDIWAKIESVVPEVKSIQKVLTINPGRYVRSLRGLVARALINIKTPRSISKVPVLDFHRELKLFSDSQLDFPAPKVGDIASYFCTGGTTGTPKIAVRTHRTEVANALQASTMIGPSVMSPGRALFCGLPLFHVNAQLATGLAPWACGAHVVLGGIQGYRTPKLLESFWAICQHYRITLFSGVPTVYSSLLSQSVEGKDLSSIQFALCGAAPMPVETFKKFESTTKIKLIEGYGLTEAGFGSSLNPPAGLSKVGSIGISLPWQKMRSVQLGTDGNYIRDSGVNEIGTILVTGPNLFKGYLDEQHNQSIWVDCPGATGANERWLNTGDLGLCDADDYFWLTGRKKELIIRGGHNIDPKLIEEALCLHPLVRLAAAVPRPDIHAGEVPVAYVVLNEGANVTVEDLLEFSRKNIPERAAVPKDIKIVESIPLTAIGKIYKPELHHREVASVVLEIAASRQIELTFLEVVQDSKRGLLVVLDVSHSFDVMSRNLSAYTFAFERRGKKYFE